MFDNEPFFRSSHAKNPLFDRQCGEISISFQNIIILLFLTRPYPKIEILSSLLIYKCWLLNKLKTQNDFCRAGLK